MTLKDQFYSKMREDLKKKYKVKSVEAVPKIEKIVVNMGIGKNRENKAYLKESMADLTAITGQKPSERKAKVSISNFKLRKGQPAGMMVTLRGSLMWDFYEKLVKIVLPRTKDFRGISKKSFDGAGNYNLGFEEHIMFPEINPNDTTYNKPLQVTIKTTAKTDEAAYVLLKALGMPFPESK